MIGILDQVCDLQKEKKYQFIFENGNVLVIQQNAVYYHVILHYENDCIFLEWSNNAVFSGIVAYSLYETYGLPLEDTVDEVSRYGLTVDEKGFYICVIIDLFARKVIAHKISYHNSTQLTKSTFKSAYETRHPSQSLIFHSDNESNYKSQSFMTYFKELGITQSFSRPHVPYDNSVMESFFSNMKREELYRTKYRSENELRGNRQIR